jgi:hypothetical protein
MNLRFAIEHRRVYGCEIADALRLDPANFSRRLRWRTQFAPHPKARIAELLGFPADWLFAEMVVPGSTAPRSYVVHDEPLLASLAIYLPRCVGLSIRFG